MISLQIIMNKAVELTTGEERMVQKLKEMYRGSCAYLYIQPNMGRMRPDLILIDPRRGICIIEVKDWSLGYIRNINNEVAVLIERVVENPILQVQKYLNACKTIVLNNYITVPMYAALVFMNLGEDEMATFGGALRSSQVLRISKDQVAKLRAEDLFRGEVAVMSEREVITVRTSLFPECRISNMESISALDVDQLNFAQRMPLGHYMITGVPGSGKTSILITRAIYLLKEHPDWQIKIVTFTNSLADKIELRVAEIAAEYMPYRGNINTENISVSTLHKMAQELHGQKIQTDRRKKVLASWWDTSVALALNVGRPTYDAVLIDEFQDFKDTWIRLCIQLCKSHTDADGRTHKNIFLAGDKLQSIYNVKAHNWSQDFGMDMRGRSKLLKNAYRTGMNITRLALTFLKSQQDLEEDVRNFYCYNEDELKSNVETGTIDFIEGTYAKVKIAVDELFEAGYDADDILILTRTNDLAKKFGKYRNIKILTYHSAKGIEQKVAILLDTDMFCSWEPGEETVMQKKLLYVGLTRAFQKLILHASSFEKESYGKLLKQIYDSPSF